MKNIKSFSDHIEQLISADNLSEAGGLMLSFLNNFNLKNESIIGKNLQKQVVLHFNNLNDLTNRLRKKNITQTEAERIEKEIWIAFHQINNQIRQLESNNQLLKSASTELEELPNIDTEPRYMSTYVPKPETWHHAGWLPLLVAAVIVGVAFTVGISYSNARRKEKRAAEQAAVYAQHGIENTTKEGAITFKLVEEKFTSGFDGAVKMTIKSVKGTDLSLEVLVICENKFKNNLKNIAFSLIDNDQKGKETMAVEKVGELGEIIASVKNNAFFNEKKVHFNYAVGESRQFLLLCKFTSDASNSEKSIAVPFNIK